MTKTASKGRSRPGIALVIAFILSSLAAGAGGLPLAYVIAAFALVALPLIDLWQARKQVVWEVIFSAVFLGWVGITYLWSPYESPNHLVTLLILIALFASFVFAASQASHPWKARMEAAFLFSAFTMAVFFFAEYVTGGDVTLAFKLAYEGAVFGTEQTAIEVNRSLGHGMLVVVLVAGPAAGLAWREGGPLIGVLLLALVGVATLGFETQVNFAAFLMALIAAGITYFTPRASVSAIFGLVAGAFVVVPLTLPSIAAAIPESWAAALPHSFEIRLEIWKFAGAQLSENPILGWGFDASRTVSDEMVVRDVVTPLMPLHPHNGPLHIWYETGAIGAVLLAAALVTIGGRIAGAPRLSRLQAAAISWVVSAYFVFIFFGYGMWQEWHIAALALSIAGTTFLAARRRAK